MNDIRFSLVFNVLAQQLLDSTLEQPVVAIGYAWQRRPNQVAIGGNPLFILALDELSLIGSR